ncbi:MAG: hypothetical protein JO039_03545 [Solirubrobacterales bacterium]|nr:hypothetical protein [Solirubrobacterales bacterium]
MTDTTPLITGVDFVCIPAQDFDAMTPFYGETLGLPFVKRYGSRPGAEYHRSALPVQTACADDEVSACPSRPRGQSGLAQIEQCAQSWRVHID